MQVTNFRIRREINLYQIRKSQRLVNAVIHACVSNCELLIIVDRVRFVSINDCQMINAKTSLEVA